MNATKNRRWGRRARRETAAERAYANRWYTLAATYEVLTELSLPPEPMPAPPSRVRPLMGRSATRGRAAARN